MSGHRAFTTPVSWESFSGQTLRCGRCNRVRPAAFMVAEVAEDAPHSFLAIQCRSRPTCRLIEKRRRDEARHKAA